MRYPSVVWHQKKDECVRVALSHAYDCLYGKPICPDKLEEVAHTMWVGHIPTDYATVKASLSQGYPVILVVPWYEEWYTEFTRFPKTRTEKHHALLAVDVIEDRTHTAYPIMKAVCVNSYGEDWWCGGCCSYPIRDAVAAFQVQRSPQPMMPDEIERWRLEHS